MSCLFFLCWPSCCLCHGELPLMLPVRLSFGLAAQPLPGLAPRAESKHFRKVLLSLRSHFIHFYTVSYSIFLSSLIRPHCEVTQCANLIKFAHQSSSDSYSSPWDLWQPLMLIKLIQSLMWQSCHYWYQLYLLYLLHHNQQVQRYLPLPFDCSGEPWLQHVLGLCYESNT